MIEPISGCIAQSLKVIGDKWTGLIVRDLTHGPRRFGELEESLAGISPRTLSQRLDTLEAHQIVSKRTFAEAPPRVEYSLTKEGEELIPILQSMVEWGAKHLG